MNVLLFCIGYLGLILTLNVGTGFPVINFFGLILLFAALRIYELRKEIDHD